MRIRLAYIPIVAALLGSGCTMPDYRDASAPFACTVSNSCPNGFSCRSGICVREDSAPLPDLIARSASPLEPLTLPDRDRSGALTCWMPREASGSPHAIAYGSFIGTDGVVHGSIPLIDIDATASTVFATCAPIPDTQGKVLVGVLIEPNTMEQETTPGRLALYVWSPDAPNGYVGTASTLYEETALTPTPAATRGIRGTLVGDLASIPIAWRRRDQFELSRGFPLQPSVLQVGRAEIDAWQPVRRQLVTSTNAIFSDSTARILGGAGGVWVLLGDVYTQMGWFAPSGTFTNIAEAGYGALDLLASNTTTTMSGTPLEEAAILWTDPLENGAAISYRVAWKTPLAVNPRIGPRAPFRRANTPHPGAFRIGQDLYLIGAAVGAPVQPASLDGGTDGSAADDAASEAGADASAFDMPGPLTVYRIPWGASSGEPFTTVTTIEPRVARSEVVYVSAVPMPDDPNFIAISWVEFYPSDTAGNGARYVLYAKRQALH